MESVTKNRQNRDTIRKMVKKFFAPLELKDYKELTEGYGIEPLNEHQRIRALWYDIYLMLSMTIECGYRKYETMDQYNWTTEVLVKQFEKLKGE